MILLTYHKQVSVTVEFTLLRLEVETDPYTEIYSLICRPFTSPVQFLITPSIVSCPDPLARAKRVCMGETNIDHDS